MSGSSLYAEVHRDFELGSVGLWIRWQMRGPSLALARSERLVDGRAHLCERVAFAWRRANRIAVCAHPEPCLLMVPQFETAASISPALWRHCLSPCFVPAVRRFPSDVGRHSAGSSKVHFHPWIYRFGCG